MDPTRNLDHARRLPLFADTLRGLALLLFAIRHYRSSFRRLKDEAISANEPITTMMKNRTPPVTINANTALSIRTPLGSWTPTS